MACSFSAFHFVTVILLCALPVAPTCVHLSASPRRCSSIRTASTLCAKVLAEKLPVEGGKQTDHKFCHLFEFTWFILQHPKEFLQTDLELQDLLIALLMALFQLLIGCI